MLNEKRRRLFQLDGGKSVGLMTEEERDAYFSSLFGMSYAEFLEEYKDETADEVMEEVMEHIRLSETMPLKS
jgi:hypothetical protein